MRIALTITELDPGGAEACLVGLACYLVDRGHQVEVFALGPKPSAGRCQLVERLSQAGISVRFGSRTRLWQFPLAIIWLRKQLKAFAPDVVQGMLFHANVVSSLALPSSCRAFYGGARVRQPERLRWRLQRFSSRRMQRLICVSQDVATHCLENERIEADKLQVIPNGINLPLSHADASWDELDITPGTPIILSVGRLAEQKGFDRLIAAADSILENFPDHHIVIIGDGPDREVLDQQRRGTQHHKRIHLVGWQPQAIRWMAICELFVLPTRYEGMPNAVLEAMATGCPMVVFGVDGVPELVGQGKLADAQIAAPDATDEFTEKVINLLGDPDLQADCGATNKQRIADNFRLDDQLAKYEQLYLRHKQ